MTRDVKAADEDPIATWVRDQQEILWDELKDAIGRAVNGAWSIEAANVARRIVEAARLVGPTRYGAVPWSLLAGGVYAAVLEAGGLTAELPDDAEWSRLDRLMSQYGTRAAEASRLASTVDAISSGRERNWIRGGGE